MCEEIEFNVFRYGDGFYAKAKDYQLEAIGFDTDQLRDNIRRVCKIHFSRPVKPTLIIKSKEV